MLNGECDADDEDDVKACPRMLKAPGVGQFTKPDPLPPAAAPVEQKPTAPLEKKSVEKSETGPATATVVSKPTHTPALAAHVERDTAPSGCQKYFSAVGKIVEVPCGE